jgi:hypothetical protein
LGERRGAVLVFVAILIPVLIGIGALAMDITRAMETHTELQAAVDAASLAAASELNRADGARDRGRAAAQQAIQNMETFATAGTPQIEISTADCLTDTPDGTACMRFLSALPEEGDGICPNGTPGDECVITAAYEAIDDAGAGFVEVRGGTETVTNFFIRLVSGQDNTTGTMATAVAGQTNVFCDTPPLFMCNPTEPDGNGDLGLPVDLATLAGDQLALFMGSGSTFTPGNFGLLCPIGLDDPGTNCGGADVAELLASEEGTCINPDGLTTKTGVTLGQVRTGINARFDYWFPQASFGAGNHWRDSDSFPPAVNVTQGEVPPPGASGAGAQCTRVDPTGPNDEAMGPGRDSCLVDANPSDCPSGERYGEGDWDYEEYFRVNHGCVPATPGVLDGECQPADWPVAVPWPPTRYHVYRYEIEMNTAGETGDPIPDPGGTQTAEDGDGTIDEDAPINGVGDDTCYKGTAPTNSYDFFADLTLDLDLLRDRRITPIAVLNCNAAGSPSGKFTFEASEFVYVFFTEPMPAPSDTDPEVKGADQNMYVEVLGALDEGAVEQLSREIVQIYRR